MQSRVTAIMEEYYSKRTDRVKMATRAMMIAVHGNSFSLTLARGDSHPLSMQRFTADRNCSSFSLPIPTMPTSPTKATGNFDGVTTIVDESWP